MNISFQRIDEKYKVGGNNQHFYLQRIADVCPLCSHRLPSLSRFHKLVWGCRAQGCEGELRVALTVSEGSVPE